MKPLFLVFLSSLIAFYAQADSSKLPEQKDFILICEVSKMARSLSQNPLFTDKAERVFIHSKTIESVIKTDEVKNVMKAVSVASPDQKVALLKQAAADVGLKKWTCPTLKYLY